MSALKPWHRTALVLALGCLAVSLLVWIARNDPAISFLPRQRGADWIVFPAAVDAYAHSYTGLDATFRHEFTIPRRPGTARLSVRALRRAEVKINGASVQLPQNPNWKQIASIDVGEQLRAGTNVAEVRVFNHNGPPALWLALRGDQLSVATDQNWEVSFAGSSWRHAALATAAKTPGRGNAVADGEDTFEAAQRLWPLWTLLLAVAGGGIILWHVSSRRLAAASLERAILLLVSALWLLLFWNNTRLLPFHAGFDAQEHLKYIDYIQTHWSLPLPTDGWEMYQPPLYYFSAAVILLFCKLSINDPSSVVILRALGAFFGIAQSVLVFLTLRLLFPARTALIGLLIAAFLPMHFYLAHYVTNEVLTATLATLTLYLCLRLLKNKAPRVGQFIVVGLALGATMLTKATGILLLPVVIAAIFVRLIHRRAPAAASLGNLGLLLTTCLAVCGWHYVRIWMRFGTPLLGNWDVMSGFNWWQDPGYHTAADYLRFGRSLIAPIFSGFAGVADGVYSTLWGDGLSGGASSVNIAWNLSPMAAGYLWALVPTALILVGLGIAIVRFVRQPSAELLLLLGFFIVVALGLTIMTLKIPSYAQAKAFYGLSALAPLCFFGALGWEAITESRPRFRFIISALLLVWALNSVAAFWIIPSVSQHLYAVKILGREGKIEQADTEAGKAIEADPSSAAAHGYRALTLIELRNDAEAITEGERAVELSPTDPAAHVNLAIAAKPTDAERAIVEARRAIELGPENFSAYQLLMTCLLESARYNEAAELGPEWLAMSPFNAAAHSSLAVATAHTGDLATAARQLGYIMMLQPNAEQANTQLHQIVMSLAKASDGLQRLREIASNAPDSPRMLYEIAWLLATDPDSQSRDGPEAVRLAERACALTDRSVPVLLATLAAAYAEAGDFSRAVAVGEEAFNKGQSSGDTDAVRLSEDILASVRAKLPYHQQ
ncbi:MAG TPA: glycosyltransferase family 39 protein [Candidatus Udaeobacter sp.]|jgi:tetratricopeptide (TPR) repeat protein|nr:glycosyltransferase family 39 protein [Candidatus Udaeobacter sp.]